MKLTALLAEQGQGNIQLERNSLKNQSTELLRRHIISGRIPPGTKLAERELAELLGISRMPARDALMDLEREGLVVCKSNGRYVIDVGREEIEQLFAVRLVLERLAVSQAAAHVTSEDCAQLQANLERMAAAIANNDLIAYLESDLEAHQLIWKQAANPYLLKSLNSIVGPIFMFMASQIEVKDNWLQTYQLHTELVQFICAGDAERAVQSIEAHIQTSVELSHRVLDH
jgi:DNA-binding GntR family transcriptional regulator